LDLDKLRSFDDVMAGEHATLNLKRGMAHHHDHEPDDHCKTFLEDHPDLKDLTDLYECNASETQEQHQLPTTDAAPLFFVRIMSEKMMAVSRKAWSRNRGKDKNHKTDNK
jgi:hypothetical protein